MRKANREKGYSLSFGSMLSLASTTGAAEIPSLGYYNVVFVLSDSERVVDADVNNFFFLDGGC